MARNTQAIYREACRRSHRVLASYLALTAWRAGLEGVCIIRKQLLKYLGLRKIHDQRVNWLKKDIEHLFPYAHGLRYDSSYYGDVVGTFHSLFIARRPFPEDTPYGSQYNRIIKQMRREGFLVRKVALPSENHMITVLAAAAAGTKTI